MDGLEDIGIVPDHAVDSDSESSVEDESDDEDFLEANEDDIIVENEFELNEKLIWPPLPAQIACSEYGTPQTRVEFKNLTDFPVFLYWIDFDAKPLSYGLLPGKPRAEEGLVMYTYLTHSWFVVTTNHKRCLLDDSLLYFPVDMEVWKALPYGWISRKWNLKSTKLQIDNATANDDWNEQNLESKFLEILILPHTCLSLKELSLLRCCEMYLPEEIEGLEIPSILKRHLSNTYRRYFR